MPPVCRSPLSLRLPGARLLALVLTLTACAAAGPAAGSAHGRVVLGVNTANITTDTGAALDAVALKAGVMPKIAMYYQDWNEGWSTALLNPRFTQPILDRGAIPMVTWSPLLDTEPEGHQPAYAPVRIAAGAFDPYIRRAARETAAFAKPVMIRLAHEMNGWWYPWGAGVDGNKDADYVAMWRHVVSIFREEGATNARWVWSPNIYGDNGLAPFETFYPGDAWVDYVALDGYNWGSTKSSGWKQFAEVFGSSYDALTRLTSKPVIIAETGSAEVGGDKAEWIRRIVSVLPERMPGVRALVWFDRDKETDWRIDSSPGVMLAFRGLATSQLFSGTVEELLSAPPTPPTTPTPPIDPPVTETRRVNLKLRSRSPQRTAHTGRVRLRARCQETCRVVASGHIVLRRPGHPRRRLPLRTVSRRMSHGTIVLRLGPHRLRSLRKALRSGYRATAAVRVAARAGGSRKESSAATDSAQRRIRIARLSRGRR